MNVDQLWRIYLPDGTKATLSGYLTEESARAAIGRWRVRQENGGRPDCTLNLDEMEVRRGW